MRKKRVLSICVCLAAVVALVFCFVKKNQANNGIGFFGKSGEIYMWVSPNGSDLNDGTRRHPFASLQEAFQHVRQLRQGDKERKLGAIHIIMRGGTYYLDETICLTEEDSGSSLSPTIIEAAKGETPILSGGEKITEWSVAQNVLGLPDIAQGKIWAAKKPEKRSSPSIYRQMWVNDVKMRRASTLDDLSLPRLVSVEKVKGELVIPRVHQSFSHPEQLEMTIIQDWTTNNLRVQTLQSDGEYSSLTFMNPESSIEFKRPWPILRADAHSFSNHMFFLSNTIELLNRPQEWVFDNEQDKFYYWPRHGESLDKIEAIVPRLETLVKVNGSGKAKVENIIFKGITFEHTTWLRPSQAGHIPLQAGQFIYDAYSDDNARGGNVAWVGRPAAGVSVEYASAIAFEECTFQHMGSTALDFVKGTNQTVVRGCVFNDIGGTGVLAGYFGDEQFEAHLAYNPEDNDEICQNLTIDNNYITQIGTEDWGCVGIGIGYAAGVTISHNEIFGTPYSAISMGWGWTEEKNCMHDNHIVANYIHSFSNQMRDSGAIYTLSSQSNSSISYNRIEDVGDPLLNPVMWDMRHAQFDLYLDEGSDYFTVNDNWCERGEISKNKNGSHNIWGTNDNSVDSSIKDNAGIESGYQHIKDKVMVADYAPVDSIGEDNRDKMMIDFVAQREGFKYGSAIAVDLNNDNKLDIVYSGAESNQVQVGGVRVNMGNYCFAATQGIRRLHSSSFATGDLNGDGYIDIVQSGSDFRNGVLVLWMNDGAGRLVEKHHVLMESGVSSCGIADINNDGLTDYFCIGDDGANIFFFQKPDKSFERSEQKLALSEGLVNVKMVYADFNNDRSVDFCVFAQKGEDVFAHVYYNDGRGLFTDNMRLDESIKCEGLAYADVNNDGYIDITVGGTDIYQKRSIVVFYLNDQHGRFVKSQVVHGYEMSHSVQPIRFCDWDNDGNTDLIISGFNLQKGRASCTELLLNNGNGYFKGSDLLFPGVSESSIEFANFGNEGLNDLMLNGNSDTRNTNLSGNRRLAVIYRNQSLKRNTPPTTPLNLVSSVSNGGTVTIGWDAGTDMETAPSGLSYNYYIRDLNSGRFLIFPNSDLKTGSYRVSGMGNAWKNHSWDIHGLPKGKYAWSVQTVDAAFAGSPFAVEQTFTIP